MRQSHQIFETGVLRLIKPCASDERKVKGVHEMILVPFS